MSARRGHGAGFLHRYFLWLLVGAYVLAAVTPAAGQWLAGLRVSDVVLGHAVRMPVPGLLLGVLLFGAGLAVKGDHLRGALRRPLTLAIGLAVSVFAPVLLVGVAAPLIGIWPEPAEARDLIVGLAVVAAMPVAGSSAGWSRAADGDCALSLGLILLSTILSPFTTPLALGAAGSVATGEASSVLASLAGGGAGVFLAAWVILPMAFGLFVRWVIGAAQADAAGPCVKSLTSTILLVLCYANASSCLPGAVADPDWDFLALVAIASGLLCCAAFVAGFIAARGVRADPAGRAALVFGVGMANNGAGLALAAGALAACPMALLPVVAVNLSQHLAAGWADARLRRGQM